MTKALQFDFTVDKESKSINVKREFAANVKLVWDAWTKPELMDQWWAPKPYQTKTKFMDFREGGHWLYCMVSPENIAHWCKADYISIIPYKMYKGLDAFCDEEGIVNEEMPRSNWCITFNDHGETTLVEIVIEFAELSDLEKNIELGFKEGFTMALGNLDQLIKNI
jgi:uncharacterized protein YndB with AHSA1/START domain